MKNAKGILVGLVLLALFGIVGAMDYEDEEAAQEHYCDTVRAGHWPDYQGTYRSECRRPIPAPN